MLFTGLEKIEKDEKSCERSQCFISKCYLEYKQHFLKLYKIEKTITSVDTWIISDQFWVQPIFGATFLVY